MFLKYYWKSIAWGLIIFIGCALPSDELGRVEIVVFPHFDKVVHLGLFFILTFLIIYERQAKNIDKTPVKSFIWAGTFALLYGAFIEVLQYLLFTSRSASFGDIVANIAGIFMAISLYLTLNRYGKKYFKKRLFVNLLIQVY